MVLFNGGSILLRWRKIRKKGVGSLQREITEGKVWLEPSAQ